MASSGYAGWSVTAGEVPTTAKWNILGANDASFNTGNGFNDGLLIPRHFSLAAVPASAQGVQSALQVYLNAVQNITLNAWNAVSWNGTYLNAGAIPYVLNGPTITVPYTGIYEVYTSLVYVNSISASDLHVAYGVNVVPANGPNTPWTRVGGNANGGNMAVTKSLLLSLNSGDSIIIFGYADGGSNPGFNGLAANGTTRLPADSGSYASIIFRGTAA